MSANENLFELVIDFVRRLRSGEAVTLEEFRASHPDLAPEFEVLVEQVLGLPEADTGTLRKKLEEDSVELLAGDLEDRTMVVSPDKVDNYFDGRYRKRRMLGEGGYGQVFLVEDSMHGDERLALKIIRKVHTSGELEQRFRNEIRVLRALNHPGIPMIFNDGKTKDGEIYYTMSFVDGRTLHDVLEKEAPLSIERIQRFGLQLLEVLAYAHGQGVVHRDLKPSNIVVLDAGTPQERVQVLDFGIAKILRHEGLLEQARTLGTEVPLGTPHYMAPEQVRGQVEDGRTDLYALGIILYQMCSARLPFRGKTSMELLISRLEHPPRKLTAAEAPDWLRDLLGRILTVDKAKRPSLEEVRQVFLAVGQGLEVTRRRRGRRPAVLLAAGLLAVAALGWALTRGGEEAGESRVAHGGAAHAAAPQAEDEPESSRAPRADGGPTRPAVEPVEEATELPASSGDGLETAAIPQPGPGDDAEPAAPEEPASSNPPAATPVASTGPTPVGILRPAAAAEGRTVFTNEATIEVQFDSPAAHQCYWAGGDPRGEFVRGGERKGLVFEEGRHRVLVYEGNTAYTQFGKAAPVTSFEVVYETDAPRMQWAFTDPRGSEELLLVATPTPGVRGTATDASPGELSDVRARVRPPAGGTPSVTPLELSAKGAIDQALELGAGDGAYEVSLIPRDRAANEREHPVTVVLDTTSPRIQFAGEEWKGVRNPAPASTRTYRGLAEGGKPIVQRTERETWDLVGVLQDVHGSGVALDGTSLQVTQDQGFRRALALEVGRNEFELVATDAAGNQTTYALVVERLPVGLALLDLEIEKHGEEATFFSWPSIGSETGDYELSVPTSSWTGSDQATTLRVRAPGREQIFFVPAGPTAAAVSSAGEPEDGWFGFAVKPKTVEVRLNAMVTDAQDKDRVASTLAITLRAPRMPAGFVAAPGARVNARQRLDRILHAATGTELTLVDTELDARAPSSVRPFYIGTTEVSNGAYAVQNASHRQPGEFQGQGAWATHPVVRIGFDDATAWCAGIGGRLPTSPEWEWAARAMRWAPNPWSAGDCNSERENIGDTVPCASFERDRSPEGAYDLAGNVREMCLDGATRMAHGGSFSRDPRREVVSVTNPSRDLGFRPVVDAPAAP